MNKLILVFMLNLIAFGSLWAQCIEDDYELDSQEDVDNFPINFPNCTDLEEGLIISGDDIYDLSPLDIITSIGGDLIIENTEELYSISAFPQLQTVGGDIEIKDNEELQSISGFEQLHTIGGSLSIEENFYLNTISGFAQLQQTMDGPLYIAYNEELQSISGFAQLQQIMQESLIIENNENLESISGFEQLQMIEGGLKINENGALTTIPSFDMLQTTDGPVSISFNQELLTISGFGQLQQIMNGGLSIEQNEELLTISGFDMLQTIDDYLSIEQNEELLTISGFDMLQTIDEYLLIEENDELLSISGFGQLQTVGEEFKIEDNGELLSISGFDQLQIVEEDFRIRNNSVINSIPEFGQLQTVNDDFTISNTMLTTISGFGQLQTVGGDFGIERHNELLSISGFGQLQTVGTFTIDDNEELISIPDFGQLQAVGEFRISDTKLTTISGFGQLQTIGFKLEIGNNENLQSISGLAQLQALGGNVYILFNEQLVTLPDWDPLQGAQGLWIAYNPALSLCGKSWICDIITNAPNNSTIGFNDVGCSSLQEVQSYCGPVLEAICKNTITVALQEGGQVSILVSDIDDGSTGATSSSISPSTFSCPDVGPNTVTLTVMDDNGNSSSCNTMVTVEDGVGLPGSWQSADIGTNTMGNDYNFEACNSSANDQFTFTGSGNNATSSTTDNVAFAGQELCGNGSITIKIESVSPNGYGGVMLRESDAPGARQVSLFSNLTNSLRHEHRSTTNGFKVVGNFFKPSPIWLKLERQGNWFFAYSSFDGNTFQYVHAVFVPMQSCIKFGMASFTYVPFGQAEAAFSNITISGGNGGMAEGGESITPTPHHNITTSPNHNITTSPNHLALFPNPATHHFTLQLETPLQEEAMVEVINLYGQSVATQQLAAGQIVQQWNTVDWPVGTYVLKVHRDGQPPLVKQFVVMK